MELYHATPSAFMPAIIDSGQLEPRRWKNKPSLIWMSESPDLAIDFCQSWENVDCQFNKDSDEVEMSMIEIDSPQLDQQLLQKKSSVSRNFETGKLDVDSHWVYSDNIPLVHCDYYVYDIVTRKQTQGEHNENIPL